MPHPPIDSPERLLRVTVTLLHGAFDAGTDGGPVAEWPPHPYRLFAALRAGAAGLRLTRGQDAEDLAVDALRRLEHAPPPIVRASAARSHTHDGFVPVIPDFRTSAPFAVDIGKADNRLKADAYPAITTSRGSKTYQAAVPDVPTIAFDIDGTGLSDDDIHWLRQAAIEVPYFGRSSSPALLTVETNPRSEVHGTEAYRPGSGRQSFVVWSPGLVDALDDKHRALAHDLPMHGRALAVYANYAGPRDRATQWLSFEHDDAPYRSILSARRDLPNVARSFGDADVVLLANVGNAFANGRLGIGVCLPQDDVEGVAEIGRVLGSSGWRAAGDGRWLTRSTWINASDVFATAVPVWLTTKDPNAAHAQVVDRLRQRGFDGDARIAVSHTPYLKGATRLPDGRAWHVAIKLPTPVTAPLTPWRLGAVDGVLMPLASTKGSDRDTGS